MHADNNFFWKRNNYWSTWATESKLLLVPSIHMVQKVSNKERISLPAIDDYAEDGRPEEV